MALLLAACASGPEAELRSGRAALERGDYRAGAGSTQDPDCIDFHSGAVLGREKFQCQ